jgi:hypothetical protein
VLLAGLAFSVTGCAQQQSSVPFPDLTRTSVDGMLTPAQQQAQIAEIARKKAEEEAKALKQIQGSR